MEPVKLFQSIEATIVEIFAWICLFPITLVDLLFRPINFLDRMILEMSKTDSSRFDNRMPPVLFVLFGTVPLTFLVIKSDVNIGKIPDVGDAWLMIALCITIFPFVWTLANLYAAGGGFGRTNFRTAFGLQCYVFCPVWFLELLRQLTFNLKMVQVSNVLGLLDIAILIWLLIIEWRLLTKTASWGRRILSFTIGVVLSVLVYNLVIILANATGQNWLL